MSATCYFYIMHTCTCAKTNEVQFYRTKKLRKINLKNVVQFLKIIKSLKKNVVQNEYKNKCRRSKTIFGNFWIGVKNSIPI